MVGAGITCGIGEVQPGIIYGTGRVEWRASNMLLRGAWWEKILYVSQRGVGDGSRYYVYFRMVGADNMYVIGRGEWCCLCK